MSPMGDVRKFPGSSRARKRGLHRVYSAWDADWLGMTIAMVLLACALILSILR